MTFATAHAAHEGAGAEFVGALPREGTIAFYMGLSRIESTCAALVAAGRSLDTAAAVVSRATLPDERVVIGTLASVASLAREARAEAPAILVVGEVVARRVVSPAAQDEIASPRKRGTAG